MYQGNTEFKTIKGKYGNTPLTRDFIIDLFNSGKYYEGFLCAMVWGNIGTYQGGSKRFESVFNANNKNKINNVVNKVQNGYIDKAYCSLCKGGENYIAGLGEAFFTKLLYFAGMTNVTLTPKPLIFDRNMKDIYKQLLSFIGASMPKGELNRYLDYCEKMEELRYLLKLPTAGHVEALLFHLVPHCCPMKNVWQIIEKYSQGKVNKNTKPLMFWFYSNPDLDKVKSLVNKNPDYATMQGHPFKQGNKYIGLDDKIDKLADHPEVLKQFVFPSTKTDKTKLFVYHRYVQQLDIEQLQYCIEVVNIGKFPVICLMNDYSMQDEKPSKELMCFMNEKFNQYYVIIS